MKPTMPTIGLQEKIASRAAAASELAAPTLLAHLKEEYDALRNQEQEQRADINALRRELSKLSRQRLAAYRRWQAEATRLVGQPMIGLSRPAERKR
jgi:FtsZ-binding cell division protein ZapB